MYKRPQAAAKLSKSERASILRAYNHDYSILAKTDPSALKRKLPRAAFDPLLDKIGSLLLDEAARVASQPGPVRNFLNENPLPQALADRLPDEFRSFCLALNAMKQWVAAEQAATDRYLFGASARAECLVAAETCVVTGAKLDNTAELHHTVRDGRPPIPLGKLGHAKLEGQTSSPDSDEPIMASLLALRRATNKSWAHLRRGCLEHLGMEVKHSSPSMASSARAFCRKAHEITGLGYRELLQWLDARGLGK